MCSIGIVGSTVLVFVQAKDCLIGIYNQSCSGVMNRLEHAPVLPPVLEGQSFLDWTVALWKGLFVEYHPPSMESQFDAAITIDRL